MKSIITIGFLLNSLWLLAQSNDELAFLSAHIPSSIQTEEYHLDNELGNFPSSLSLLFLGYKKFISSQDYSSCSFHPSCSVYAFEAVSKQGVIIGVLNAFDRLMRCNGMSPDHYHYDNKLNLLEDPLRDIHYEVQR